jgi:phage tail P2-like protein
MSQTLLPSPLPSLLPSHRAEIEKAIDSAVAHFYSQLPVAEIDINPASCRPDILQILAYSYNIDLTGLTLAQQRRLVAKAFELNRLKGTVYAVKEALRLTYPNAELIESADEPYIFMVKLELNAEDVLTHADYTTLLSVLEQTKNARSVLKGVEVATPDMQVKYKKVSAAVLRI